MSKNVLIKFQGMWVTAKISDWSFKSFKRLSLKMPKCRLKKRLKTNLNPSTNRRKTWTHPELVRPRRLQWSHQLVFLQRKQSGGSRCVHREALVWWQQPHDQGPDLLSRLLSAILLSNPSSIVKKFKKSELKFVLKNSQKSYFGLLVEHDTCLIVLFPPTEIFCNFLKCSWKFVSNISRNLINSK